MRHQPPKVNPGDAHAPGGPLTEPANARGPQAAEAAQSGAARTDPSAIPTAVGPERGGGAGLASDAARADGGAKAGRTIGRSSADDHPIGGDTGNDDDDRSTTVTTLPRLLVNADLAGRMIGCSGRQWRRLWHRGLVPDPVVVGSRRLWSVAELSAWAVAGAPPRVKWLAMREARLGATG